MVTGIICEYNPLHMGHKKQLDLIRRADPAGSIVCLMSGNFVQRGMPAIVDKMVRAKAAVENGADLVLELPVTGALSSAEGFGAMGVRILSPICDSLCFGAETNDKNLLTELAQALLSEEFSTKLKEELETGRSFPAARQGALEKMGFDAQVITSPNNILAVEYCKAILAQGSKMMPMPILREGNYHDTEADQDNPSATAVRKLMEEGGAWQDFVPPSDDLEKATIHTMQAGEKAILAKLRSMTDEEFKALPYGSEGLWRKLMHAVRENATLDDIITATKSKRYTRTRIDRMIMCAFLGITQQMLDDQVPYVRVLAFNDRGRQILKTAKEDCRFVNIGEVIDDPYQSLENRCGTLYGLFAKTPEAPDLERNYRIYYKKNAEV